MSFAEHHTPDEDKWRLRERMMRLVEPQNGINDAVSPSGAKVQPTFERFDTLFRPRPVAPVHRSPLARAKSRLMALIRPLPQGVNDNLDAPASFHSIWSALLGRTVQELGQVLRKLTILARRSKPKLVLQLRPRLADLITIPLALTYFIVPLLILLAAEPNPTQFKLGSVLIGAGLFSSLIIGARFGTIATLSAFTWLALTVLRPPSGVALPESLVHWVALSISAAALAGLSLTLGLFSLFLRSRFALGHRSARREADIAGFHAKLRRAHNAETILSYIVAYCRDVLKRRAIFLALDETDAASDAHDHIDIAARLKSVGYARVVVDRRSYTPRAMQSFTQSGYKAYPLETPSGTIGILGLDVTDAKPLSPIDERYFKLLLLSAAYALERIFLKEKINALEEREIDAKARNVALLSIVRNLTQTTENLDDQAYGLHQLLDKEPHRPYETAINFIRRNISALRNSIALLRDVTN